MVNIKKNLTLQQKRFRAAVDYSSCICKSGGEAARGSLPALSPHSDQVISLTLADGCNGSVHPGPGLKRQASSLKRQAFEPTWSSIKRQASKPQAQGSSVKPQAASSLILEPWYMDIGEVLEEQGPRVFAKIKVL